MGLQGQANFCVPVCSSQTAARLGELLTTGVLPLYISAGGVQSGHLKR